MIRFRYCPPLVALLVGAAMLAAPTRAHAVLEIALQEAGVNGGAITVVATGADFTAASYTATYGDFKVTLFGASSDNAADLSDLLSSTVKVTNNNGATKTLKLYITQTDYTLPEGNPLTDQSSLGGSINQGTLGLTNIFQAYADKNNNAFGTSDFTNGPQSATSQPPSAYSTGTATGLFSRLPTNYSLTSVVTFTLSGKGSANYSSQENVTGVPVPAGVVLALTGLPVLGIGWLRRRLKKRA